MRSGPKSFRQGAIVLLVASAFTACATAPVTDLPSANDLETLKTLNTALTRSQIVERDPAIFDRVAVDSFRVLAPGGVVETKAQAIQGLKAWDAVDVKVTDTQITQYGHLATVTNRLDIDGIMKPVGRWGPLKSMRVFSWEDGEWRLVSQALTDCHPMAVKVGRC